MVGREGVSSIYIYTYTYTYIYIYIHYFEDESGPDFTHRSMIGGFSFEVDVFQSTK